MIHIRTGHLFLTADRFGIDLGCRFQNQNPTDKTSASSNKNEHTQDPTKISTQENIEQSETCWKSVGVIINHSRKPLNDFIENQKWQRITITKKKTRLSASYFLTHLLHVWNIIFTYIYHEFVVIRMHQLLQSDLLHSPNGGHVFSPDKVTYGSKRGHDLKNLVDKYPPWN